MDDMLLVSIQRLHRIAHTASTAQHAFFVITAAIVLFFVCFAILQQNHSIVLTQIDFPNEIHVKRPINVPSDPWIKHSNEPHSCWYDLCLRINRTTNHLDSLWFRWLLPVQAIRCGRFRFVGRFCANSSSSSKSHRLDEEVCASDARHKE